MSDSKSTEETWLDDLFKQHAKWSYSNGKQGSSEEIHYYQLNNIGDLKQNIEQQIRETRIDELQKAITGLFPDMAHPGPDSDPVMRVTADAVVHYENERLAIIRDGVRNGR